MLKAFVDESGTHEKSPVITVAAFMGRPIVWRKFTQAWNVKKRPVKVFHATDCNSLRGEFKGWSREYKNNYVTQLLPVLGHADLASFVVGIRMDDFREVAEEFPRIRSMVADSPYAACFHWLLMTLVDTLDTLGNKQRISIVHEANDMKSHAERCFSHMLPNFGGRTVTLSFGSKQTDVPLQAADILAYEANRRLRDKSAKDRIAWSVINPPERLRVLKYFDADSLRAHVRRRVLEGSVR